MKGNDLNYPVMLGDHAWFYRNASSIDVYIQPPDDRFKSGFGNAVSVRVPLRKIANKVEKARKTRR